MDRALIERAIESAKHRQYKLSADLERNISEKHRTKAEKQKEVAEVTVMALERMFAEEEIIDKFAEKLCDAFTENATEIEVDGIMFDVLTVDGAIDLACEIAGKLFVAS